MSLKEGTIDVGACKNIKIKLQQKNLFNVAENDLVANKKPWALLCAAFEPSIPTLDDSVRALRVIETSPFQMEKYVNHRKLSVGCKMLHYPALAFIKLLKWFLLWIHEHCCFTVSFSLLSL